MLPRPRWPAPANLHAQYDFRWSGIPLGTLDLHLKEADKTYSAAANARSRGLVKLFTKHKSFTRVKGDAGKNDHLMPRYYETFYRLGKKKKQIKLWYDAAGSINKEQLMPARNPQKRPPVPEKLSKGAPDPLTGFLQLRQKLHAALSENRTEFSYPLFDGKRLMRVKVKVKAPAKLRLDGKPTAVHHLVLTRSPIAGWRDKELKKFREKGEPPIHFYVTADARYIPVKLWMEVFHGTLTGTLIKECASAQECRV